MNRRSAARVKLSSSATATKARSSRVSRSTMPAGESTRQPGQSSTSPFGESEQRRDRLLGRGQRTLELEQEALALQAARVAGQRAGAPEHAVAGDDDRQRVAGDGAPDGASQLRAAAEPAGQLAVGRRLAVGDLGEKVPDPALEAVAGQRGGEVEGRALAGEILGQL